MDKELDVVELENGNKYAVLDAINYDGRTFVLLGKLNETLSDIEDEYPVFEKIDDKISIIDDNDLLEKLVKTFEKRITNK